MAGLKGHNSACAKCHCSVRDLHSRYSSCSASGLPWEPRCHDKHLQELMEALRTVDLTTEADRQKLLSSLRFLHSWPWGRTVKPRHGQSFGLMSGDRLVIGGSIVTIHDVETVPLPARLWFFRLSKSGALAGPSLMYHIPGMHSYGVDHFTIERFVDCTLHTVDLGVAAKWHGSAF